MLLIVLSFMLSAFGFQLLQHAGKSGYELRPPVWMAIGRIKRTGGGGLWDVVRRVTPAKVRNPDLPATQYFDEEVVVWLANA